MMRKNSNASAIARQQKVVAVVDDHAERRIEIGAAAPAGLARRLVDDDVPSPVGEAHRGGKPGEASPDDVDDGLLRHALLTRP